MNTHALLSCKSVASCLALLAFSASPLRAADALFSGDIAGPYIAEALLHNPGLKAQDKRYLAAMEALPAARALPNPKLQLTHFVESIRTRTGPQRQAISLQQELPAFGKRAKRHDLASAEAEALQQAYHIQQFKLADEVAKQILELAYLQKAIRITQENIGLLERLETIVADKVKAGGSLSDLLRIQVEIERFRDSQAKQQTALRIATVQIDALLGRPTSSPEISIAWSAPKTLPEATEKWLISIQGNAPQVAMLRAISKSQEARERLAQFARRPDLSLGLNYIRTGDALNPSTPRSGADPWALMVGISLPIWQKANHAAALQASLENEAIEAELQELELQLRSEGHAWIARLEDAHHRIQRYDAKLLPLARQAQEITQSSYQSGNASILDLIETERALLTLETEYWRTAADAWLARWKLATLSGGLWLE